MTCPVHDVPLAPGCPVCYLAFIERPMTKAELAAVRRSEAAGDIRYLTAAVEEKARGRALLAGV